MFFGASIDFAFGQPNFAKVDEYKGPNEAKNSAATLTRTVVKPLWMQGKRLAPLAGGAAIEDV